MKKYNVVIETRGEFQVEAENEHQASELAWDEFMEDPATYELFNPDGTREMEEVEEVAA